MTEYVSTLAELKLRGSRYIFLLSNEKEKQSDVQRSLDRYAPKFGDGIKLAGRVIRATSSSSETLFMQLTEKNWPPETQTLMITSDGPFLTIMKTDFDDFDPHRDDWRIVWLSVAKAPRQSLPRLFEIIERLVNRDGEVFAFLDRRSDNPEGRSVYGQISSPGRPAPILTCPSSK